MINRINLILRAKNLTARQFAEEIGIQPSGMSHIMSGRNNPSLDFVSKVIRRYPEIDANWLLLGRGEMYASSLSSVSQPPQPVEEVPREAPTLFGDGLEPVPQAEPVHQAPVKQALAHQDDFEYPVGRQAGEDTSTDSRPRVEEYANTGIATSPGPVDEDGDEPRLKRILFFYSDNTFREYRPRE